MENTIYDSNKEVCIGFYGDLAKGYRELVKEFRNKNDTETAQQYQDELMEIKEWRRHNGLLELSENGGMGFTCRPYRNQENEKLNKYECTFLIRNDADIAHELFRIMHRITENGGGSITEFDHKENQRLAYSIQGEEFAYCIYMTVYMESEMVQKISSWLNINDSVLRYLIVKADERRH